MKLDKLERKNTHLPACVRLTHTSARERVTSVTPAKIKSMNEKLIEKKLRIAVKELGGTALKFYSAYQVGLPDRIVLMPGGKTFFVELKSTGKQQTALQKKMSSYLSCLGFEVFVIDTELKLQEFLTYVAQ